jgi:hypothetical protein
MTNPRFPSKVDTWLAVLLVGLILSSLAVPIVLYATGDPQAWIGLLSTALIMVILGGLVFPLYYELEDDALLIRFGMVRSRVPYAEIRRVVPSRSMLSSPALSLDRLHVDAGSSLGPLISPRDKSGFLDALATKAPQLVREGDSLVARE